jgi:hypothetical protein
LQACQVFEIFSPETLATDVLLNSHTNSLPFIRNVF